MHDNVNVGSHGTRGDAAQRGLPRYAQPTARGAFSDYAFQRLAALLAPLEPPPDLEPIDLSIGSPMHPPPQLLIDTLAEHGHLWNRYPPIVGTPALREAAADWLGRRYGLPAGTIDPDAPRAARSPAPRRRCS